jgi:hypothetical protein
MCAGPFQPAPIPAACTASHAFRVIQEVLHRHALAASQIYPGQGKWQGIKAADAHSTGDRVGQGLGAAREDGSWRPGTEGEECSTGGQGRYRMQ